MISKTITVSKSARYYLLGKPGPQLEQVWIACHGYGQLAADFAQEFQALDNGRNMVAVPEGLNRFYLRSGSGVVGASWMTKEDRANEIMDYINYLDSVYTDVMNLDLPNRDSMSITALGFSQGAATASRWALHTDLPIHRLVLWGGDFPPDTDWDSVRNRLDSIEIILVAGTKDPYYNRSAFLSRDMSILKENRVTFTLKTFDGHHEIDTPTLKELMKESFKV